MYSCNYCGWSGSELYYDITGQGRCPKCNHAFRGCVSEEEYDRRMKEWEQKEKV